MAISLDPEHLPRCDREIMPAHDPSLTNNANAGVGANLQTLDIDSTATPVAGKCER